MVYQAQINATEPDKWLKVSGSTMQDAAVNALRRVGVKAVTWPCTVYVGDPRPTLQHENKTPMVVHAFTLELCKEVA